MTIPLTAGDQVPSHITSAQWAVVVATRNRGERIRPLLESLTASEVADFEVIVVDQSDDHETRKAVEAFTTDGRVRYTHSSVPGASRSRNVGAALTTAPYIVVTDDDCIVPPDFLPRLTQPFEDDPRVGVVFCQVAPVERDEIGLTPAVQFPDSHTYDRVGPVWRHGWNGLFLGAGMAVRRTAFEQVGGFDESLGPGARFGAAEDNDLGWRILLRGWRLRQNATVTVVHDGFRPLSEVRALIRRDFYGVGGAAAKYVRMGQWGVFWLLGGWLFRNVIAAPASDLLHGRRPRGPRRVLFLLSGLLDGLRVPGPLQNGAYRPDSSAAHLSNESLVKQASSSVRRPAGAPGRRSSVPD